MLSSVECLAKARQMDSLAVAHAASRQAYAEMAQCWRRNAIIARQQDAWTDSRPLD